jgi:hypothetical protein
MPASKRALQLSSLKAVRHSHWSPSKSHETVVPSIKRIAIPFTSLVQSMNTSLAMSEHGSAEPDVLCDVFQYCPNSLSSFSIKVLAFFK